MSIPLEFMIHALQVNLSTLLLYGLLGYGWAHVLLPDEHRPSVLWFHRIGLAIAFQGVGGVLLMKAGTGPVLPYAIPFLVSGLVSAWCFGKTLLAYVPRTGWPRWKTPPAIWLAGLLACALVVRLLDPLQHWALGQSDAYSHLQFIQSIIATQLIFQVEGKLQGWLAARS